MRGYLIHFFGTCHDTLSYIDVAHKVRGTDVSKMQNSFLSDGVCSSNFFPFREVPKPTTNRQRIAILKIHTESMVKNGRVLVKDAPYSSVAWNRLQVGAASTCYPLVAFQGFLYSLLMSTTVHLF